MNSYHVNEHSPLISVPVCLSFYNCVGTKICNAPVSQAAVHRLSLEMTLRVPKTVGYDSSVFGTLTIIHIKKHNLHFYPVRRVLITWDALWHKYTIHLLKMLLVAHKLFSPSMNGLQPAVNNTALERRFHVSATPLLLYTSSMISKQTT